MPGFTVTSGASTAFTSIHVVAGSWTGDAGQLPGAHDEGVQLQCRLGQLGSVVDAGDQPGLLDGDGGDLAACLAQQSDDIGEVLLALGVVRRHVGQLIAELVDAEDVDAGVRLADGALGLGRVLLLDDAVEGAVGRAHDAAVARDVVREQRHHAGGRCIGPVRLDEATEGVGVEEGHVAVDDEHLTGEVGRQRRDGELHRAACAGHLVLIDDHALGHVDSDDAGDPVALVTHDADHVRGLELAGGGEHVRDDRHAAQRMQQLRQRRLHAGALAGGEDDDGELRIGHGSPWMLLERAPPPGLEPGPNSSKGCRAAITLRRTTSGHEAERALQSARTR